MGFRRVNLLVLAISIVAALALLLPFSGVETATAAPEGTVTLLEAVQIPVSISNIAPGDQGSAGSFRVRYVGTGAAWIGLDTDLIGPLAEGENPLTVTVTDGKAFFSTRKMDQVVGLFSSGELLTLSIEYRMPRLAGNPYQGLAAMLLLQVHAVEAEANTLYENGRAVGPVTWAGRVDTLERTGTEVPEGPSGGSQPCVGDDCSPNLTRTPDGQPGEAAVPEPFIPSGGTRPVITQTCCDCVQSLLWIGLLYGLLLVLAMLSSFYMGWRLCCRYQRRLTAIRTTTKKASDQIPDRS